MTELSGDIEKYHTPLLAWFDEHQADLPWRHNRSPYRVWLSEIMLQQTQVATVIPYYERFLARFPTVEVLAAADINEVLKLWEGLGYYSRARNLHKAAQMVVNEFDGAFPETVDGLKKLPGIGNYTSGAVASMAFNQDVPVVDGNVIRVLTRWVNIADDVTKGPTKRHLWAVAQQLVPHGRAANWNEALMDLGRTVCTPVSPRCETCPVNHVCEAYALGVQAERPVKAKRKSRPHYDYAAAVIQDKQGRYLLAQRPFDGLLGGLWEFPGGRVEAQESIVDAVSRTLQEKLGLTVSPQTQLTTVQHGFTHYKMTRHVFICDVMPESTLTAVAYEEMAWVELASIDQYALPVTDQKIAKALNGGGQLSFDTGAMS